MKKMLLAAVAMMMAVPALAQPDMALEKELCDFGKIAEKGGKVVRIVNFTNTGDEPLVILKTKVTCTCTTVSFTKKPVMPGDDGMITITYNPRRQSGTFHKEVLVYANIPDNRKVITIKGSVE